MTIIEGKNNKNLFLQFLKNPHSNMKPNGGIVPSIKKGRSDANEINFSVSKNMNLGAVSIKACNSANGFPHTIKSGTTKTIDIEMINPSKVTRAFLIFLRNINTMMIPKIYGIHI